MKDTIAVPGFPMYELQKDDLKILSFHKCSSGRYRSLECTDTGLMGYTLYNNGKRKFFSMNDLIAIIELDKIKNVLVKKGNKMVQAKVGVPMKGDYVIGSLSKMNGGLSFSEFPAKHMTLDQAKTEATRLATTHKDRKFIIMKVEAIASTTDVVWE